MTLRCGYRVILWTSPMNKLPAECVKWDGENVWPEIIICDVSYLETVLAGQMNQTATRQEFDKWMWLLPNEPRNELYARRHGWSNCTLISYFSSVCSASRHLLNTYDSFSLPASFTWIIRYEIVIWCSFILYPVRKEDEYIPAGYCVYHGEYSCWLLHNIWILSLWSIIHLRGIKKAKWHEVFL